MKIQKTLEELNLEASEVFNKYNISEEDRNIILGIVNEMYKHGYKNGYNELKYKIMIELEN